MEMKMLRALTSRKFAAALLTATMVLPVLAPVEAQARINGPVLDSFSAGCLMLQNKSDALIAEYKNATNARREEILQELRNNGRDWINLGCRAVFGDISRMVILDPPNRDIGGLNTRPPLSLSDGNSDSSDAPVVPSFL